RRSRSRRRHHVLEARRHDESDRESGEYNDRELLGLPAQRLLREDVAPPKGGAFFLRQKAGAFCYAVSFDGNGAETSRSSRTSTTARPRSWTSSCARPARSIRASSSPNAPWTRTISRKSAASRFSRRTPQSAGATGASTSSTRRGTRISEARSNECCRW